MMMSTAGNYASRSLLNHLLLTLSGFVAFLLLLDMMDHGDEVVRAVDQHPLEVVAERRLRRCELLPSHQSPRRPTRTTFSVPDPEDVW